MLGVLKKYKEAMAKKSLSALLHNHWTDQTMS